MSIVGYLGMRMDITAALVTTKVSIKIRANMPELMENSAKLPLKILVHEARKIKTENVEHLLAAGVK
tara:strand:- start:401 stop:601 length:201 start_codon:yes stop_codon:yes gene_type:complete